MSRFLTIPLIQKIHQQSIADAIPIVRDQTAELIIKLITDHHYVNILEIGTAYGYSSAIMCTYTSAAIVTLEKDSFRYEIAHKFLKDCQQVKIVNTDCFTYIPDMQFDLIFIDGPKKNQIDILNHYKKHLKSTGRFFIDNIYLHKLTDLKEPSPKQLKIINDLYKFVDHLQHNDEFDCTIYDIDDGVAILQWKK